MIADFSFSMKREGENSSSAGSVRSKRTNAHRLTPTALLLMNCTCHWQLTIKQVHQHIDVYLRVSCREEDKKNMIDSNEAILKI